MHDLGLGHLGLDHTWRMGLVQVHMQDLGLVHAQMHLDPAQAQMHLGLAHDQTHVDMVQVQTLLGLGQSQART